jgi:hypothetical protein
MPMNNQTLLSIAIGAVLVTGLIAIPVIEEADAKCVGFKKNGDILFCMSAPILV